MTTPDRLEQVLIELEALERAAKQSHLHRYREAYEQAAGRSLPLLRAKLRAAVEMEKAVNWTLDNTKIPSHCRRELEQGLAAWQQAGEEQDDGA